MTLKDRIDVLHKTLSTRPKGMDSLDYPPREDSPDYPAWLEKARAWCLKHEGRTFEEALDEAKREIEKYFPGLD